MRTINFTTPKSWLELNNKQLLFISKLFISDFAKDEYKFLTHVFMKFSKLRIKRIITSIFEDDYILKLRWQKPFKMTAKQIRACASNLDFLLKEVTEIRPVSQIRKARPCNFRLYNTTFGQFLTAENFYMAYTKTSKEFFLDCLIATLYNKRKTKFDDSLVRKKAKYFRNVDLATKYSVYLWYSGFRWLIAQRFQDIFSGGDASDQEVKIQDQVMDMIRALTEGDVTKQDNVRGVDTWSALTELNAKAKAINESNPN